MARAMSPFRAFPLKNRVPKVLEGKKKYLATDTDRGVVILLTYPGYKGSKNP